MATSTGLPDDVDIHRFDPATAPSRNLLAKRRGT